MWRQDDASDDAVWIFLFLDSVEDNSVMHINMQHVQVSDAGKMHLSV